MTYTRACWIAALVVLISAGHSSAFELQGQVVGKTTLSEFRAKYHRTTATKHTAPFCSDTDSEEVLRSPGPTDRLLEGLLKETQRFLLFEEWMPKAGIVACSTTFPVEHLDDADSQPYPTLAGVPTKLYVFHFMDGVLYEIVVAVDRGNFSDLQGALVGKFGQPAKKRAVPIQNRMGAVFSSEELTWKNARADMILSERTGSIDTSVLVVSDRRLRATALARRGSTPSGDL